MDVCWQKKILNLFALAFVFVFLNTMSAYAGPNRTTYQAKIVKPDGYPLEATSVNFKFTILDPAGSCILYAETYSSVNMSSTGGLISFALGSGVKTYPVSATTFAQVFSNITPTLSCDAGGPASYAPLVSDTRKIVMQFHDGNGWQTLPAMAINAVPYAMYANEALTLNGKSDADFVEVAAIPSCLSTEALRYNGSSFSCIDTANVSGAAVVAALGYTPATGASVTALASSLSTTDSTVASVSSSVFSVSSTVSSLANTVSTLQSTVAASFAAITSSQWVTSGTTINYNAGNVGIGTASPVTKLEVSGGVRISMEAATCAAGLAGTLRYNGGNVEYCNGVAWSAFGVSSSGLTLLNASASQTQTFATGITGTVFNISTVNGVHTFNIPLAASSSVTAGLLSNLDYATFTNKMNATSAAVVSALGYTPLDSSVSGTFVLKANNLSDLASATVARTNLGLGSIALLSYIDLSGAQVSGTLAAARLPAFSGDASSSAGSAVLTLASVGAGVTSGTQYTKVTVDGKGRVTSGAQLASADVTTALGYTPASASAASQWLTSGSTVSYSAGNVGVGTAAPVSKLDVSGGVRISMEAAACSAAYAGTIRYNLGNVEYCNGTSWSAFGVAGAGITNINGSTSGAQTFANGSTGTQPAYVTANGVHTLNIPLASAGSVTAGLLSNVDYTTFMNKITSSAASIAQVLGYVPASATALANYAVRANNLSDLASATVARTNLGLGSIAVLNSVDLSGVQASGTLAAARLPAFSGDASSSAGSAVLTLASVGSGVTSGTQYTKVSVDGKGRVISGAQLVSTDVTTALGYTPASASAATQWNTSGTIINYTSGNVGIGTTAAPAAKLEVAGATANCSASGICVYENLVQSSNANQPVSGTLKISMPLSWNNTMMAVTISGYNYTSNTGAWEVVVGGYNWTSGSWVNTSVDVRGTPPFTNVRLAHDGTSNTILIGDTSTIWTYPKVAVTRMIATHGGAIKDWGTGWGISYITDETGISNVTQLTLRKVELANGNFGLGVPAPSARLHLAAGTSSNSPLKLSSGTLLSSPQSGTIEYDGARLYFTDGSNMRRALAINSSPGSFDNTSAIANTSGNITLSPNNVTGSVIVSATTASTNSQTGSLVVKGGLGIAGNLFSSGTIVTSSNIQGSSITATSGISTNVIQGNMNLFLNPNGGNVGIGTIAPAAKLDVSGDQYIQGIYGINFHNGNYSVGSGIRELFRVDQYNLTTGGTFNLAATRGSFVHASQWAWSSTHNGAGKGVLTQLSSGQYSNISVYLDVTPNGSVIISADWGAAQSYNLSVIKTGGASVVVSAAGSDWTTVNASYTRVRSVSTISEGFQTVNAAFMGNVGVGTSAPGTTLHIAKDTSIDPIAFLVDGYSGSATTNVAIVLRSARGTKAAPSAVQLGDLTSIMGVRPYGATQFSNSTTANVTAIATENATDSAMGTALRIMTTPNGSATSLERLKIDQNGNVGIGTSTPAALLDVSASTPAMRLTNSQNLTGTAWAGTTIGGYELYTTDPSTNGTKVAAAVRAIGGADSSAATLSGDLAFFTTPLSTTTPVEQMRILSTGNIGLGTTTPTAKLHLPSGTTTTAPLKFTTGSLLASPQSGTIEYDGTYFYVTDGANSRKAIVTDTNGYYSVNTLTSTGNMILSPNSSVFVSSTAVSTNSATGALVVSGGLGIGGNISAAGAINTTSTIQGTSITATTGFIAPYIAGGVTSGGALTVDSTTHAGKGNIYLNPNGGKVGIGYTSPAGKLHIGGSMSGAYRSWMDNGMLLGKAGDSDGGYFGLKDEGANRQDTVIAWGDDVGDNLRFIHTAGGGASDGVETVRITSTGYVGIGVTAPTQSLTTSGNVLVGQNGYPALFLRDTSWWMGVLRQTQTSWPDADSFVFSTPTGRPFVFQAGAASQTEGAPLMYIDTSGAVGIGGVTGPLEKLDVSGSINVRGQNIYMSHDGVTNVNNDYLVYDDNTVFGSGGIYSFFADTTRGQDWTAANGAIAARNGYFTSNLAIGTTVTSRTLEVNGSINAGGMVAETFTFGIDGTINGTWAIGSISNTGTVVHATFDLHVHNGSTIDALKFQVSLPTYSNGTFYTGWQELPVAFGSSAWNGQKNYVVDVLRTSASSGNPIFFRVRNKGGNGSASTMKVRMTYNSDQIFTRITHQNTVGTAFNASTAAAGGPVDGMYGALEYSFPVAIGQGWRPADNSGLFVKNSGFVGIGTSAPSEMLEVSGSVKAVSYLYTSDRRLKKNIITLPDALAKVLKLRGVNFVWKNNDEKTMGFIAQEVEEVYPELVKTDKASGFKAVQYGNIVAILVEAIKQENKERIEAQNRCEVQIANVQRAVASVNDKSDARINQLEKENRELKSRLEKIEKFLNEKVK